ncbi:hypothetical protein ACK9YZ_31640 [Rhizobium sp. ZK1]
MGLVFAPGSRRSLSDFGRWRRSKKGLYLSVEEAAAPAEFMAAAPVRMAG